MTKTEILYSLILIAGVFISSVSQVLLKKSALAPHDTIVKEYVNPRVITAYSMFVLATVMTIIAFKKIPLSWGTLLDSTGYIFVTVFGLIFFGEKLTPKKALALGIIIVGIIVYSL